MKTKLLVLFTIITIVGVGMIVLKDNFGKYNKQVNYGYKLLETGKDVLPPTPEQNNTNLANNDNSETNIDTLQNGTDLSKDLYKSLEDELKAEYGMISNTKFNYSLTESSNNIIS